MGVQPGREFPAETGAEVMNVSPAYNRYDENNSENYKEPTKFLLSDVLLIKTSLLHVHYYSKPNNAQKLFCIY